MKYNNKDKLNGQIVDALYQYKAVSQLSAVLNLNSKKAINPDTMHKQKNDLFFLSVGFFAKIKVPMNKEVKLASKDSDAKIIIYLCKISLCKIIYFLRLILLFVENLESASRGDYWVMSQFCKYSETSHPVTFNALKLTCGFKEEPGIVCIPVFQFSCVNVLTSACEHSGI